STARVAQLQRSRSRYQWKLCFGIRSRVRAVAPPIVMFGNGRTRDTNRSARSRPEYLPCKEGVILLPARGLGYAPDKADGSRQAARLVPAGSTSAPDSTLIRSRHIALRLPAVGTCFRVPIQRVFGVAESVVGPSFRARLPGRRQQLAGPPGMTLRGVLGGVAVIAGVVLVAG